MKKLSLTYIAFIWIFCLLIAGISGYMMLKMPKKELSSGNQALEKLGSVPDFNLTTHHGEPLTANSLRGRVWVAEFFFSACPSICPIQQKHLQRIQTAFQDIQGFHIVGFTVDPENDTPKTLAQYAKRWNAIKGKWDFVTGDKKTIYKLIREGFKVGVEHIPPKDPGGKDDFIHTDRFALVDRTGTIRGYYRGTDPSDLDRLITDIETLLHDAD